MVDVPANIDPIAAERFRQLLTSIRNPEKLSNEDRDRMREYCEAYASRLKLVERIANEGEMITDKYGRMYPHPAYVVISRLETTMARIAIQLGLAKKTGTSKPTKQDEGIDLLEWVRGK